MSDISKRASLFRSRWRYPLTVMLAMLVAVAAWWRLGEQRAVAALVSAEPDSVLYDARLRSVALPRGRGVFLAHCASCHGDDAKGNAGWGVPDLTDRDRLYGEGKVAEIEEIVRHGIRAGDRRGWDLASMPAFGHARPYARYRVNPLSPRAIDDLAQFVLSLSDRATDQEAANRGGVLFQKGGTCYDCHLRDARGDPAIGAPDLTDRIWLFGGSAANIRRSIADGRAGYSPAFRTTLDAADERAVAVYVADLPDETTQRK